MSLRARWGIGAAGLICLAGKLWAPAFAPVLRHFFAPDMLVSLGVCLVFALICSWVLPERAAEAAAAFWLGVVKHRRIVAPVFLAGLLGALLWVNRAILHSFLNSADEHSCYFFAELIRMGKWWVKPHELSEFFNVVHVGNRDGKWFSVYPPGWPLLWALGLQLRAVDWLNPVLSVLSLPLLYGAAKRCFGRAAALGGILLAALSPFFMFTAASYFSHAACLFTMALFLYAFVRWHETKNETAALGWACLAAAACGYGLMTRYLTMAAFALPFLIWHYLPLFLKKKKWQKADGAVVLILSLFVLAILYQNYAVTGKPFKAPNKYDKSWERLGFKGEYSMAEGLLFILLRFFYLMDYSAPLLVVLFMAGMFRKPPQEPALNRLVRYSFFYGSFVYFLYYSWGGNQYGPRYWWESFPFLGIALGDQIGRWWREGHAALRKFLIGALLVSVPAAGWSFYKQGTFLEQQSRERKALYVLAEETLKVPAIVFIHGFLGDLMVIAEEDAVRNSPKLDARILYAHDLGARNPELMRAFPEREYYRGTYDRKVKGAVLERIS
ncbi:MAG: hypothetical protein A2Z83_04605 [Omnitrophica bacterium GWA2_52_8]|nr:MAG: hypothetical protein A2Z83_04605 [Omnitrophica bacterium GWA2_52_8]